MINATAALTDAIHALRNDAVGDRLKFAAIADELENLRTELESTQLRGEDDDYWVVLTQGKGDRRYSLHARASHKQGAIDIAYAIALQLVTHV